MPKFTGEDDLATFEEWLKSQKIDPAELSPEHLTK